MTKATREIPTTRNKVSRKLSRMEASASEYHPGCVRARPILWGSGSEIAARITATRPCAHWRFAIPWKVGNETEADPPRSHDANPRHHCHLCAARRQRGDGGGRAGHARRERGQTHGAQDSPPVERPHSGRVRRFDGGCLLVVFPV